MSIELGDVTLEHLTHVSVDERARIVLHPVPGMSGDLSQTLGRPSVVVRFRGIFYGDSAADDLGSLRSAYLDEKPLDFFTEAVGEGYFAQVLITRMEVQQRAGYLDQFDYLCEVVEYVEPPEPAAVSLGGLADLAGIDADLLGEAASFMDDVQNALQEVSGLVDLVANAPNFGDPTTRLPAMLDQFKSLTGGGLSTLTNIRDIFS
jgi:hypothetical protein